MPLLSPKLVKRSLGAHSAMGLVIAAMMYMICLSGSLLVLAEYLERWEQPTVAETTIVSTEAAARAIAEGMSRATPETHSVWAVYPNEFLPRPHLSLGEAEWFFDANGTLGEEPAEGATVLLRDLHYYLLLPQTWGMIVVSAMGAMLLTLIMTGLFAHPKILRDAFHLRWGKGRRLEQVDMHNRLSVWGLPFHIMIAVTGAFFGLVGPLVFVAAAAFYDGHTEAVFAEVYGGDPAVDAEPGDPGIENALDWIATERADEPIVYAVVHHPGERDQFIEVATAVPGRLVYSEIYQFDGEGAYLGDQGLASGPAGRQVLYSVYRLHFGHFGGLPVRIAYLLMGLAITVVSVSGVNIWLARRGGRSRVNDVWCAVVWGAPLALSACFLAAITVGFSGVGAAFTIAALVALGVSLFLSDEVATASFLKKFTALLLLAAVVVHVSRFGVSDTPAAVLGVNGLFTLTALLFLQPWHWLHTGQRMVIQNG